MTYRFHPAARAEYLDAIAYYRSVRESLAEAFVDEVERSIASVLVQPEAYPQVEEDIRRYLTRRFPFGVFYTMEADGSVFIVAVMHLKRRPGYWHGRLAGP